MSADLAGLAALPCLGPASARMLIEAGIETPAQLKKLGAAKAYRALRFAHGKRAGPAYLYALDNAIRGVPWRGFTEERLAQLKPQAERIVRELDSKKDADFDGLAAMPSLGKASARRLIEIGVRTPAELRRIGAEEAYRRLRHAFGKQITASWIYALDVAIRDIHWQAQTAAQAAKLKAAAQRIQLELAAASGAAGVKRSRKRA